MIFKNKNWGQEIIPRTLTAYLVKDHWDDWGKYETLFNLYIFDSDNKKHEIGMVKIADLNAHNLEKGGPKYKTKLPGEFENLPETFFSIGQGISYYENLNELGSDLRETILKSLNDIALNEELFDKVAKMDVVIDSLTRGITFSEIKGQYRRLTKGGALLTPYKFTFELVNKKQNTSLKLDFNVKPESYPPTNIHVLIGRNGVGKSYLISKMVGALCNNNLRNKKDTSSINIDETDKDMVLKVSDMSLFANVVAVSFSAFDEYPLIPEANNSQRGDIGYSFIGIKQIHNVAKDKHISSPKTPIELKNEFMESVKRCYSPDKKERLLKILKILNVRITSVIYSESG